MADIVFTSTNVKLSAGQQDRSKTSLESMAPGDVVFLSNDGTEVGLSDSANASSDVLAGKNGLFIALNSSTATGQPVALAGSGTEVDFGAGVLQVAEFYAVSPTVGGGKIKPSREILTGEWHNIIGYAKTGAIMVIQPLITSLQRP